MRTVVSALVIFSLALLFCFIYEGILLNQVEEMIETIPPLKESLLEEDLEKAQKLFDSIENSWEKNEAFIGLLMDQDQLNEVPKLIAEVQARLQQDSMEEVLFILSQLEFSLKNLIDNNTLSFFTIL